MSTGSVDERIRTVLDLGDSSAAVKGLDAEVEKLLDAFKKQTELFEQGKMTPKQYADALHTVKSEVSGLSSAMKELGGGAGSGVDFEGVNRKIFALERGMTAMVSGTGLGRAGTMLESGLSLVGGPAGLGVMAALIANTIDQIAPKVKTAWDNLFHQFSQEDVTAKISELKGYQTQLAAQVKALLDRPVPGTEDLEASRQKYLGRLFNVGTMTGPKGISNALVQALKNTPGATSSEMTGEEKQELEKYWAKLHPKEQAKKMWEQGGGLAVVMQVYDEIANLMAIDKSGQQIFDQHAQEGIAKIRYAAVQRTMGKLMVDAQKPGKEGLDALTLIKDLATRFPDAFKGGLANEIDKVLRLSHQLEDITMKSGAAAVVHHPGATDMQREQQIEAMEQGRIGSRSQQEARFRQMFERQVMERMMAEQGLKMSDPNQRALMEHQAKDEWRIARGGPHKRSEQAELERDLMRRQRTIELIREHPEMTFDEAESQSRREINRRERATDPARFYRHRPVRSLDRRGPQSPEEREDLRMTGMSPEHFKWQKEQADRARLNDMATSQYKGQASLGSPTENIQQIRGLMDRAVSAQQAGLISQEKMTSIVHMLQATIDNNIMPRIRRLNKAADDLARQQTKSAQNSTGNP